MRGLFYSIALNTVRTVTIFDEKREQLRQPFPGEGILPVDDATFAAWAKVAPDGVDINQSWFSQETGTQPVPSRYVVIQNGVVVGDSLGVDPVMGDLNLLRASWPQADTFIPSEVAGIGWTYNAGQFINTDVVVAKGIGQGAQPL